MAQAALAIADGVRQAAAESSLTADAAKDALRAIDALAGMEAAQQGCRDATARVIEAVQQADVLSRGHLVMQANLLARLGDGAAAAEVLVAAHATFPDGFTETHGLTAWRHLSKRGTEQAEALVRILLRAGVPLATEGDTTAFLSGLQRARGRSQLTEAIEYLERSGGFSSVIAAGRAMNIVRTAQGRTAEHVMRLTQLATATCGLSVRVVNDALVVLAELGAADESEAVLRKAVAAGLDPTAEHRLAHVTALANAMRFEAALAAYQQYLDDGFPASIKARRVQVYALLAMDETGRVCCALLDWAADLRDSGGVDPPASLLTAALSALLRDDVSVALRLVEGSADVFTYNGTHRKLVLDSAARTRAPETLAAALAAFARGGAVPSETDLERLIDLTADCHAVDVEAALMHLVEAAPETLSRLALPLALAQIAGGDLAAAEATARLSGNPAVVQAVVTGHLSGDDLDGALRTSEILDVEDDGLGARAKVRRHMPHPPVMVAHLVRVLAVRTGPPAAETWMRRYPQVAWPMEAWEALALAYRRDGGKHKAIERLMERMRRVGRTPSSAVWTQWLSAFPRARRTDRVDEALRQMAADKVVAMAGFHTAAIVGALLPEKVLPQPDRATEDVAWENARKALCTAEELLVRAVRALSRHRGTDPEAWFTPAQLLEIARSYPLRRRPFAQLDAVVEVRLNEDDDADEQFAAFLGAVASAHARALLPAGVERLREAARPLGLADRPDLVGALFDAHGGSPQDGLLVVQTEVAAGAVQLPAVAQAAGRLLAGVGSPDAVLQVLDLPSGTSLDRELAEELASAAVRAFHEAGQADLAQELGRAAAQRNLVLSTSAQASLMTTYQPQEALSSADEGPVWTTAELAAYNSLLQHELANHLRVGRNRTDTLATVVRKLREQMPPEVQADMLRYLDLLDKVERGLRVSLDHQQRSIDKIAAAAEQERVSAGAVNVRDSMDVVIEQLGNDAEGANSRLVIQDRDGCASMAVRAHATLLQFALHNLVTNALKAHGRRKDDVERDVELLATFDESDRDDLTVAPYGWVVVSVRDHGDGVPADLPDNVANWTIPGQPGQGAGIGLRVTENMIRQAGGQLWVDTAVTEGSRFCFRLPSAARRQGRASRPIPRKDNNND
ncbi:sensor histidine kinase [Modestobacter sp. VKM Ac-2984]|uniref:sensor histidine kinase n=1 Tax=Modestobacter sp. VKM Ac-2984 TaxID=3004138 RepID=UPI0022AB0180|nr:ATP-binding protein [Modestobacter sp. VKM Ac-2984]MCZ2817260.1 ATP-binding protein [Modestobacter sp. VKM Ac-2984]